VGIKGFLSFLIASQLQPLLLKLGVDFNNLLSVSNIIAYTSSYLINIVLALVILKDIMKHKIKAVPVVLLTILSHFAGIVFFLFLINSKISSNDK
jgi:hypothetical protein